MNRRAMDKLLNRTIILFLDVKYIKPRHLQCEITNLATLNFVMLRCLKNAKIKQTFFDAINAISSLVVKHRVLFVLGLKLFTFFSKFSSSLSLHLLHFETTLKTPKWIGLGCFCRPREASFHNLTGCQTKCHMLGLFLHFGLLRWIRELWKRGCWRVVCFLHLGVCLANAVELLLLVL